MDNSAEEGRITVMLASAVYASHVALSTYSMCLSCMLQYSLDIDRRLCSINTHSLTFNFRVHRFF